MYKYSSKSIYSTPKRAICWVVIVAFTLSLVTPVPLVHAQGQPILPLPGVMVTPSPAFYPAQIKGLKIYPDQPLRFDFIVDTGSAKQDEEALSEESTRLIKYFLASLTVPEEDLWVNLSPYESNRIIPAKFAQTEMGRDLLAQDYLLKQLTASLLYPEEDLGEEFWVRVYAKAQKQFGTTDIPVNTFNKVWVVPQKAVIHETGTTAMITSSRLKVMLESDYLALRQNLNDAQRGTDRILDKQIKEVNDVSSSIVKEIILPEIEKEVNEGENFAPLRQIYHSMILAAWFKQTLQDSLIGKIYVGENKIDGIAIDDPEVKEKIYKQYMEAFRIGVYNYIKEDFDQASQSFVPRKYFAGGMEFRGDQVQEALAIVKARPQTIIDLSSETTVGDLQTVSTVLNPVRDDSLPAGRQARLSDRQDLASEGEIVENLIDWIGSILKRSKEEQVLTYFQPEMTEKKNFHLNLIQNLIDGSYWLHLQGDTTDERLELNFKIEINGKGVIELTDINLEGGIGFVRAEDLKRRGYVSEEAIEAWRQDAIQAIAGEEDLIKEFIREKKAAYHVLGALQLEGSEDVIYNIVAKDRLGQVDSQGDLSVRVQFGEDKTIKQLKFKFTHPQSKSDLASEGSARYLLQGLALTTVALCGSACSLIKNPELEKLDALVKESKTFRFPDGEIILQGQVHTPAGIVEALRQQIQNSTFVPRENMRDFMDVFFETTQPYLERYRRDITKIKAALRDPKKKIKVIGIEKTPSRLEAARELYKRVDISRLSSFLRGLGYGNADALARDLLLITDGPVWYMYIMKDYDLKGIKLVGLEDEEAFSKTEQASAQMNAIAEDLVRTSREKGFDLQRVKNFMRIIGQNYENLMELPRRSRLLPAADEFENEELREKAVEYIDKFIEFSRTIFPRDPFIAQNARRYQKQYGNMFILIGGMHTPGIAKGLGEAGGVLLKPGQDFSSEGEPLPWANDPLYAKHNRLKNFGASQMRALLMKVKLVTDIQPDQFRGKILVVGSSSNISHIETIKNYYPQATIEAVEWDRSMAERLQQAAPDIGVHLADARNLQAVIADRSMDMILLPSVLDLYENVSLATDGLEVTQARYEGLRSMLLEAHRILNRNGLIVAGFGSLESSYTILNGLGLTRLSERGDTNVLVYRKDRNDSDTDLASEGQVWYNRKSDLQIDPEKVGKNLRSIRQRVPVLLASGFRLDLPSNVLRDEVIDNYVRVIRDFNAALDSSDMTSERMMKLFKQWHRQIAGVAPGHYWMKDKFLQRVFDYLFSDEVAQRISDDPDSAFEIAGEIFYELYSLHPYQNDGHHRAISLIVNYILIKAGHDPFYIDVTNFVHYRSFRERIYASYDRDEEWAQLIDELATFFDRSSSKAARQRDRVDLSSERELFDPSVVRTMIYPALYELSQDILANGLDTPEKLMDQYLEAVKSGDGRLFDTPVFVSITVILAGGYDPLTYSGNLNGESIPTGIDVESVAHIEQVVRLVAEESARLREEYKDLAAEQAIEIVDLWQDKRVQRLEKDLFKFGVDSAKHFKEPDQDDIPGVFQLRNFKVYEHISTGLQLIEKPDDALNALAQFLDAKRPGAVPTFRPPNALAAGVHYELNLSTDDLNYSELDEGSITEEVRRKIIQAYGETFRFQKDKWFVHGHAHPVNIFVKTDGHGEIEDVKFIDWDNIRTFRMEDYPDFHDFLKGERDHLRDAWLGQIGLEWYDFDGVDFSGADVDLANFTGSRFRGGNLKVKPETFATFNHVDVTDAIFSQDLWGNAGMHYDLSSERQLPLKQRIMANRIRTALDMYSSRGEDFAKSKVTLLNIVEATVTENPELFIRSKEDMDEVIVERIVRDLAPQFSPDRARQMVEEKFLQTGNEVNDVILASYTKLISFVENMVPMDFVRVHPAGQIDFPLIHKRFIVGLPDQKQLIFYEDPNDPNKWIVTDPSGVSEVIDQEEGLIMYGIGSEQSNPFGIDPENTPNIAYHHAEVTISDSKTAWYSDSSRTGGGIMIPLLEEEEAILEYNQTALRAIVTIQEEGRQTWFIKSAPTNGMILNATLRPPIRRMDQYTIVRVDDEGFLQIAPASEEIVDPIVRKSIERRNEEHRQNRESTDADLASEGKAVNKLVEYTGNGLSTSSEENKISRFRFEPHAPDLKSSMVQNLMDGSYWLHLRANSDKNRFDVNFRIELGAHRQVELTDVNVERDDGFVHVQRLIEGGYITDEDVEVWKEEVNHKFSIRMAEIREFVEFNRITNYVLGVWRDKNGQEEAYQMAPRSDTLGESDGDAKYKANAEGMVTLGFDTEDSPYQIAFQFLNPASDTDLANEGAEEVERLIAHIGEGLHETKSPVLLNWLRLETDKIEENVVENLNDGSYWLHVEADNGYHRFDLNFKIELDEDGNLQFGDVNVEREQGFIPVDVLIERKFISPQIVETWKDMVKKSVEEDMDGIIDIVRNRKPTEHLLGVWKNDKGEVMVYNMHAREGDSIFNSKAPEAVTEQAMDINGDTADEFTFRLPFQYFPSEQTADLASEGELQPKELDDEAATVITTNLETRYSGAIEEASSIEIIRLIARLVSDEDPIRLSDQIRPIFVPVLANALRRDDSGERTVIWRLIQNLSRTNNLIDMNAPDSIIEGAVRAHERDITKLFAPEEQGRMLLSGIDWGTIPRSALMPEDSYESLVNFIRENNPQELPSFVETIRRQEDSLDERKMKILRSLINALPESDVKTRFAENMMAKLNAGVRPEVMGHVFVHMYFDMIDSLDRRVGRLTNKQLSEEFYGFVLKDYWHALDAHEYAVLEEKGLGFTGIYVPEGLFQGKLLDLFSYNPGPDFLRIALSLWKKEADGNGKPMVNNREFNAFQWIINNIPKKRKNTRDRRRQIHRYLVRMGEFRMLYPNSATSRFMGDVISTIDTVNPEIANDVDSILDFILDFSNLGYETQEEVAAQLLEQLREWRQAEGRKLFMKGQYFEELRAGIYKILVSNMLSGLRTFDDSEKARLEEHMDTHKAAWLKGALLPTLAAYIGFQNEEGKLKTEDFLKQLMNARVDDHNDFVDLPRYTWADPRTEEWLGESLINKLKKAYKIELEVPEGQSVVANQYEGIYQDIMTHIGARYTGNLEQDKANVSKTIDEARDQLTGDPEQIDGELAQLKSTLHEVLEELSRGEMIDLTRVRRWRKTLLPSGETRSWYKKFRRWREVIVNLDQITSIRPINTSEVERLVFEISDNPVHFIRSYMEPYPTCQRCTEPTSYNDDGRPINRARQGHFLIATVTAYKKDGTDEIVSRSLLEIGGALPREQVAAMVQFGVSREELESSPLDHSVSILLSERLYDTGLVPGSMVQKEIIKWAMEDDDLIHFIKFAKPQGSRSQNRVVKLTLLPSDGPIYRDTFAEGDQMALDLDILRESGLPEVWQIDTNVPPSSSSIDTDLASEGEVVSKLVRFTGESLNKSSKDGYLSGFRLEEKAEDLEKSLVQDLKDGSYWVHVTSTSDTDRFDLNFKIEINAEDEIELSSVNVERHAGFVNVQRLVEEGYLTNKVVSGWKQQVRESLRDIAEEILEFIKNDRQTLHALGVLRDRDNNDIVYQMLRKTNFLGNRDGNVYHDVTKEGYIKLEVNLGDLMKPQLASFQFLRPNSPELLDLFARTAAKSQDLASEVEIADKLLISLGADVSDQWDRYRGFDVEEDSFSGFIDNLVVDTRDGSVWLHLRNHAILGSGDPHADWNFKIERAENGSLRFSEFAFEHRSGFVRSPDLVRAGYITAEQERELMDRALDDVEEWHGVIKNRLDEGFEPRFILSFWQDGAGRDRVHQIYDLYPERLEDEERIRNSPRVDANREYLAKVKLYTLDEDWGGVTDEYEEYRIKMKVGPLSKTDLASEGEVVDKLFRDIGEPLTRGTGEALVLDFFMEEDPRDLKNNLMQNLFDGSYWLHLKAFGEDRFEDVRPTFDFNFKIEFDQEGKIQLTDVNVEYDYGFVRAEDLIKRGYITQAISDVWRAEATELIEAVQSEVLQFVSDKQKTYNLIGVWKSDDGEIAVYQIEKRKVLFDSESTGKVGDDGRANAPVGMFDDHTSLNFQFLNPATSDLASEGLAVEALVVDMRDDFSLNGEILLDALLYPEFPIDEFKTNLIQSLVDGSYWLHLQSRPKEGDKERLLDFNIKIEMDKDNKIRFTDVFVENNKVGLGFVRADVLLERRDDVQAIIDGWRQEAVEIVREHEDKLIEYITQQAKTTSILGTLSSGRKEYGDIQQIVNRAVVSTNEYNEWSYMTIGERSRGKFRILDKSRLDSIKGQRDLSSEGVGGIDLNPAALELERTGGGIQFDLPVDPATNQPMPVNGFTPVIIQITPTNLPLILGSSTEDEEDQLSLLIR